MNDHPKTEPSYDERLGLLLIELLSEGPRPLAFLISQAQGAYPTDVLANLRALQRAGKAEELDKSLWALPCSLRPAGASSSSPPSEPEEDSEFPEPHPLDFDWRFSKRALANLEKKIDTTSSKSIAILGAPTLFKYLGERGKSVHLFDRNDQVVYLLKKTGHDAVTRCDLFQYSGRNKFDCVIADPPWYLDHYRAFIQAARHMLVGGRKLLLSVLPPLTRPSAENDRAAIVSFAFERGFDLESSEAALLEYLSPPFEMEALKSEGLNAPIWRSGDLFTFVLSERRVPEYRPEPDEDQHLWRAFTIGRTIIKVKWDGTHFSDEFDFQNVSHTNTIRLQSVSRRSPARSRINLWSSRNVALHVTRPDLVCATLQLLDEGHSPEHVSRTVAEVEHLAGIQIDRLRSLLDILLKESQRR